VNSVNITAHRIERKVILVSVTAHRIERKVILVLSLRDSRMKKDDVEDLL
jgi:hypothetical protein